MKTPLYLAIYTGYISPTPPQVSQHRSRRAARNQLWRLWQRETRHGYDPRMFLYELYCGESATIKECRFPLN